MIVSEFTYFRSEWFQRAGFGLEPGYERASGWGNNPDVDTAAVEVIDPLGGTTIPWLSALAAMEIVSDSAADTAAGTGARTVAIDGLDANYNRLTQTVSMNGVTAVAIPAQIIAINRVRVLTAGTGLGNAGTLTVRNAGAGTTRITVPVGRSISQSSGYTVPAGYTLQINRHLASINRTVTAGRWITYTGAFQLWDGTQYGPTVLPLDVGVSDTSLTAFMAEPGLILTEKSRWWLQVNSVSANNTDVTAAWWGILRRNEAP